MANTESEVIQTILKKSGKATKGNIVKELGISLGYLDIITRSLERRGLIKFSNNAYSLTPLAKKKSTEFIQKTKKIKLKAKKRRGRPKKRGRPRKRGRPKKQKELKESSVETLLEQRIDELKEGVAEAEKKIEEGVKNIEEKIEKELEKKIEAVEEKVEPVAGKAEELPPLVLQFGRFLFSTGKRIFDKTRSKLISTPLWISKNYKNLTKKRS